MRFERAFSFVDSPIFLRLLGVVLVALGLFGIANGLFGDLDEGEYWWGHVGIGIVSIGFSVGLFIWASGEAEMLSDGDGAREQRSRPSNSKASTTRHTLH
jgi:hypothetical protein